MSIKTATVEVQNKRDGCWLGFHTKKRSSVYINLTEYAENRKGMVGRILKDWIKENK